MMMVLFLSVVSCLQTAAQTDYTQLSAGLKTYVDTALVQANQNMHHYGHLNFYRMGVSKVTGSWVNIDVRLKNTLCRKQTGHKHRPECPFKRLEVTCRVCGRPGRHPLFIDCVRVRDQGARFASWNEHCVRPCGASCFSLIHKAKET